MANFRLPGVICGFTQKIGIDMGTMCLGQSPVPGALAARRKDVSCMKMSSEGQEFLFSIEVGSLVNVTAGLHWPGGSSGVTLGAGYDMKNRSEQQVINDLQNLGVDRVSASQAAKGAGLKLLQAKNFAKENKHLIFLDKKKQVALMRSILPTYEKIIQRNIHVPLAQHEFDALVSFAYNPGGKFTPVAHALNKRHFSEAVMIIKSRNITGGQANRGLIKRRELEVALFLHGKY